MKIIAIGGSLRPDSYSYKILEIALNKVREKGIEGELVDLRQLHLPFCNGGLEYPDYPDVEILRRQVYSSSGILLATPEYHGCLSGVLKNALDLLNEEVIGGKVVGLISIIGGVHSTNAINTLRIVCRHLQCWVLPEQVVIPHAADHFNANGQLKDPSLEVRLDKLVNHLVTASQKLSA